MNIKDLKNIVMDSDLEELVNKIDYFYKKNEILNIFFTLLQIEGNEKNLYLEDFQQIKSEPIVFRQSCLRYIENAHDNLKTYELQRLAKLF